MKKNTYICIFIICLLLFTLFIPYTRRSQYNKIENFDNCDVSGGDKKIGLDKYYDPKCISNGGLGCVGKTGCRFCCKTCKSDNQYFSIKCPSAPPTPTCTSENQDPYGTCPTGEYVECCDGLTLTYTNNGLKCVSSTIPTDRCQGVSCLNSGRCDPSNGICVCATGWTGKDCSQKVGPTPPTDRCQGVYCLNSGRCDPSNGICVCATCWTGKDCSQKVGPPPPTDKCQGVSCLNSGSCDPSNGICVCASGWTGKDCSQKVGPPPPTDKCQGVSCLNSGSCDPSNGICVCASGWTGKDCSQKVGPTSKCVANATTNDICNDHVTWVQAHIADYAANGLKPDSNFPIIQQYLYACENNICPCNDNYGGEDKATSITKFGWKCNATPITPEPPSKCKNVTCYNGQICDPDTGKCGGSPIPPSNKYTMNYPSDIGISMVKVLQPASKNYIIVIGDWGAVNKGEWYEGMIDVQQKVAANMQNYVNKMNGNGYNLLFIATTGDNFYTTGLDGLNRLKNVWFYRYNLPLTPDSFGRKSLTDYPWFPTMGNHDFGNADKNALCPEKSPFSVINGQAYGSYQLNADKGGARDPNDVRNKINTYNYYMPDFSYHVEIPSLSFEFIAMEANTFDSGGLGGDGTKGGASEVGRICGGGPDKGQGNINKKLKILYDASINVLKSRAAGHNKNFLIANHYPAGDCHGWNKILTDKDPSRNVRCVAGHVHNYSCNGAPVGDQCMNVTSGNGGGYGGDGNIMGFYVYGFKDGNPPILQNIGVQQVQMNVPNPPG